MKKKKKDFDVRRGIRTPALIRGPEISSYPLSGDKAFSLESGALDHSAILTCLLASCNKRQKALDPCQGRTGDLLRVKQM